MTSRRLPESEDLRFAALVVVSAFAVVVTGDFALDCELALSEPDCALVLD